MTSLELSHIQERIDAAYKRIGGIGYFKPVRSLDEANFLIPEVDRLIETHMEFLKLFQHRGPDGEYNAKDLLDAADKVAKEYGLGELINEAGVKARDIASRAAGSALQNLGLEADVRKYSQHLYEDTAGYVGDPKSSLIPGMVGAMHHIAAMLAKDKALGGAYDAAQYGCYYTALEVVRDLKGFENNPFGPVIKMYEMGLMPRGFDRFFRISGKSDSLYIVDFPLQDAEVIDRKLMLGCHSYGSPRITNFHEWTELRHKLPPEVEEAHEMVARRILKS